MVSLYSVSGLFFVLFCAPFSGLFYSLLAGVLYGPFCNVVFWKTFGLLPGLPSNLFSDFNNLGIEYIKCYVHIEY